MTQYLEDDKNFWTKTKKQWGHVINTPPPNITFCNGRGTLGSLDLREDEIHFTGNASESAQAFFDYVCHCFRDYQDRKYKAKIDELRDLVRQRQDYISFLENILLEITKDIA